MSDRNDGNGGVILVFAVIATAIFYALLIMFAVLAFIALVMSILSLCAWNRPLTIGKMTIHPEEAQDFVGRGICGAILLPLFVGFFCILFGGRVEEWLWPYILIAGYTAGSLGVAILQSMDAESSSPVRELRTPPPAAIAPPPQSPATPPAPFKFASWDDEVHGG
ncbi:MAG: hypothetical protein SGJ17_06430 [Hyphomicrobiales bacterium]|nr:hypothetical protein [Hyphomicrobiales bacterium]